MRRLGASHRRTESDAAAKNRECIGGKTKMRRDTMDNMAKDADGNKISVGSKVRYDKDSFVYEVVAIEGGGENALIDARVLDDCGDELASVEATPSSRFSVC